MKNSSKLLTKESPACRKDYRMVPCTDCEPLWARLYERDTSRPFFCDRDGIKKYDLSEIGYERRNGYSCYNNAGIKLLKRYEQWKKENGR
ncbi:MAG: pectate lyase [Bacteroides sp.]|uniref:pectate lyase n=1 Tax=Bacteroides sp. TaxID=29523 RepID=UPI002FC8CEB2